MKSSCGRFLLVLVCVLCLSLVATSMVYASEPITSLHVVKYASDGTTSVNETTVSYQWMEANLPVQGDGVTHYYHQGPVFNESMDKWDPEETTNFKDKGAVRGTDIADLCDLVGGMEPGDTVVIRAADGYNIKFGYENVYQPQDRQGPIVVCWYSVADGTLGQQQENGYPPRYFEAMQIVFMPSTANAEGLYVFGNWDMKECLPDEAQHFYSELYPSTNGLSLKWASEVAIYPEGALIVTPPTATPAPTIPAEDGSASSGSTIYWVIGLVAFFVVVTLLIVTQMYRRKR